MDMQTFLTERRLAGGLLIFSFILFLVVGYLFTARQLWSLPSAQTELHLRWERGMVIAAFLTSVLGYALLQKLLNDSGDAVIGRLALVIYLICAAVLVVAETAYLENRAWNYPQIVVHVVLAFLAQAAFGAALLQTGLAAPWVGWATIIWNIGLLIVMPIVSPRDMYFPWLHYIAPLITGIALLARQY